MQNPLLAQQQGLLAILNQQRQLQEAQNSQVTQGIGANIMPRAQGALMGQDYRQMDNQTRQMGDLQSQMAQAQAPQAAPAMGRIDQNEAKQAGIIGGLAVLFGANPQSVEKGLSTYIGRREQQLAQEHQQKLQQQAATHAQKLAGIQAQMYPAQAEAQITQGRVGRRERDQDARAKIAADERGHEQDLEKIGKQGENRYMGTKVGSQLKAAEDLFKTGRFATFDDAYEAVIRGSAGQTKERGELLGAQTGLANERAEDIEATREARIAKIQSATNVDDERAKNLAEETRLMPEATAIAYSRLDLAWQQFAENARQFNTREGRMAGDAAKAEVNKSLTEFNAEVKTFEGEVRKAQEAAMAALGMTEWPAQTPEAATAFAGEIARRYAAAQAIVKKNDPADPELPRAQAQVAAIEKLWRQRSGLQQAYDKRRKIKEEMESVPPVDPMGGGASIVGPGGKQYQPSSPTIQGKIGK